MKWQVWEKDCFLWHYALPELHLINPLQVAVRNEYNHRVKVKHAHKLQLLDFKPHLKESVTKQLM